MAISTETAQRAERVFQKLSDETEGPRFDPFNHDDVGKAAIVALEMALAADRTADDDAAIDDVLVLAEKRDAEFPNGIVQHGLALFATHAEKGRLIGKPRLFSTQPRAVVPGRSRTKLEAAFGPEAALDYWRENALANEHHQHWHEVYPSIGVIRPIPDIPANIIQKIQTLGWDSLSLAELAQVFRPQDRHGELFVYMHQQMLARYDAERLSHGLDPVVPLDPDNLALPIPEAFDPGPSLTPEFDPRPENATMSAASAAALQQAIGNVQTAIAEGVFRNADGVGTTAITPTVLGDQIEAAHTIHRGEVDASLYGNLHNSGHGAIAQAAPGTGVMASTATAIRDPVFFRWHKLIDNLAFSWQESQAPLDVSDAPPVTFAGTDNLWASHGIVLIDSNSLSHDDAVKTLFGGSNWDLPASAGDVNGANGETATVLDQIITRQTFAQFSDPETPGAEISVQYLAHDPVSFVFRLENTTQEAQDVTIRLFLCPTDHADDRRFWIEIDKLPVTVPAESRVAVVRHDRESAVVKKPAEPVMSPDLLADADGDPRCDCGWPYTLLYPRGTEAGMPFKLMAILTDAALDNVAPPGTCGSLSFCGARDAQYPDRRDMGYPFHRPWTAPIADVVTATPSMAGRSVTIRHAPFGSG